MKSLEEYKIFLREMQEFFNNLGDEEKNMQILLKNEELKQEDLLHEIEISKLNAVQRITVYNILRNVRIERRKYKDYLNLLKTLQGFANAFIKKGIISELNTVITNLETLEKDKKTRKYNARIFKNLKCCEVFENDEKRK